MSETREPEPTDIWRWWGAIGDGKRTPESYTIGPYTTREALLAEVNLYREGEKIHIIETRKQDFDWAAFYDDEILDALDDRNDEILEPGKGSFFDDVTKEQKRDLEAAVTDAIKAWAERHKIEPVVWAFGDNQHEEWITVGE